MGMERRYLFIQWMVALAIGSTSVGCAQQWVTIGTPFFKVEDRDVQLRLMSVAEDGDEHEVRVVVFDDSNRVIMEKNSTLRPGSTWVATLTTSASSGRVVRTEIAVPFDRLADIRFRAYERQEDVSVGPQFAMTRTGAAQPVASANAVLAFVQQSDPEAVGHRGLPIQPGWIFCGVYLYPGLPGDRVDPALPSQCIDQ